MIGTRTDTHSPRSFDPADYHEVGYFDNHPEEGGCWIDEDVSDAPTFVGNYEQRGRCDHCGAGPLRYGVVFQHTPTAELVVTGTVCASRLGLSSRSEFERRELLERAISKQRRDEYASRNPEVAQFLFDALEGGSERFEFVLDVARKLRRYGDLSEAQTAAIAKIMVKRAEQAEAKADEPQPETPLQEGRYLVEGKVLTVKEQEGYYGWEIKMLVLLDDFNKVWGTVPNALFAACYDEATQETVELKGQRVRFTAAVERSQNDEHFGFYKRPTKAELLV